MQKYRYNEAVQAGKIIDIARMVKNGVYENGWVVLQDGQQVALPRNYFHLNNPVVGGYYFEDVNGQGFMTAEAFERSYSLIKPSELSMANMSNGLKQVLDAFAVGFDYDDDDNDEEEEEYFIDTLYSIEEKLMSVMAQNDKILEMLDKKIVISSVPLNATIQPLNGTTLPQGHAENSAGLSR
jgi:hypothetical protein